MSTKSCTVGKPEFLLDFSAGRLDAGTAIGLERHIAGCPCCQEFLEGQRLVWDALDVYQRATPRVSENFDRQLYARIAAEQQENWWRRAWRRVFEAGQPGSWKPTVSMAAACAVLVMALVVRQPAGNQPVPVASMAFEKQEIESIERALEDFEMLQAVGAPTDVAADLGRELKL